MDTTTIINHVFAAFVSVAAAMVANTATPPVTFEVGSGFIWGMTFGVIAGSALWMDQRLRQEKKVQLLPLLIVMMLSSAAGFIGYTALSAANLSALMVTGGTTVCGMLGGPGLRVVCKRGMKELNKALGADSNPPKTADKKPEE